MGVDHEGVVQSRTALQEKNRSMRDYINRAYSIPSEGMDKTEEKRQLVLLMVEEAGQVLAKFEKWVEGKKGSIEKIISKKQFLPDLNPGKIKIGIEEKILSDFGKTKDIKDQFESVHAYITQAVTMPVECKVLRPAQLYIALEKGELDVVIAYEAAIDSLVTADLIQPAFTAVCGGKTEQVCGIWTLESGSLQSLDELEKKRIGYSNQRLVQNFNKMFMRGKPDGVNRFEFIKHNNALDSMTALQMGKVDAILEFEYIQNIMQDAAEKPLLKVLAKSKPIRNQSVYIKSLENEKKKQAIDKMVALLLKIHTQEKRGALLKQFNIDRFIMEKESE